MSTNEQPVGNNKKVARLACTALVTGGLSGITGAIGLALYVSDSRITLVLMMGLLGATATVVFGFVVVVLALIWRFPSQIGDFFARTYEVGNWKAIRPKHPPPEQQDSPAADS